MNSILPINLDEEPLPEGAVLIEGNFLQGTARASSIAYRLGQRWDHKRMRFDTAGIVIDTADVPRWQAAMKRKQDRQDREKLYANPETRH